MVTQPHRQFRQPEYASKGDETRLSAERPLALDSLAGRVRRQSGDLTLFRRAIAILTTRHSDADLGEMPVQSPFLDSHS